MWVFQPPASPCTPIDERAAVDRGEGPVGTVRRRRLGLVRRSAARRWRGSQARGPPPPLRRATRPAVRRSTMSSPTSLVPLGTRPRPASTKEYTLVRQPGPETERFIRNLAAGGANYRSAGGGGRSPSKPGRRRRASPRKRRWITSVSSPIWTFVHSPVSGPINDLVEVLDRLRGEGSAAAAAGEPQPPVERLELRGLEAPKRGVAEVWKQVVLDTGDVAGVRRRASVASLAGSHCPRRYSPRVSDDPRCAGENGSR